MEKHQSFAQKKIKKVISISSVIFFVITNVFSAFAQPPALHQRGMYVDRFFHYYTDVIGVRRVDNNTSILGIPNKEAELFDFCKKNNITHLMLYDLESVLDPTNDNLIYNGSNPKSHLCDFINNAKNNNCILSLGAVGGSKSAFDAIGDFNSLILPPTPPYYFSNAERLLMGSNNPLLIAETPNLEFDSPNLKLIETIKIFLRAADMSVGGSCGDFDWMTMEFEYWFGWENGIPSDWHTFSNLTPTANDPLGLMPYMKDIAEAKGINTELYQGYLRNSNSTQVQDVADYLDMDYPSAGKKLCDRIFMTSYTKYVDNGDMVNRTDYKTCLNYFRETSTGNVTNALPLVSAEALNLMGTDDYQGFWLQQAPPTTTSKIHNIFETEKLYYDQWYAYKTSDPACGTCIENNIKPGGMFWFTQRYLLPYQKNPELFYTDDLPLCTTASTANVDFHYNGPINENIGWNFTLTDPVDGIILPTNPACTTGVTLNYETNPGNFICLPSYSLNTASLNLPLKAKLVLTYPGGCSTEYEQDEWLDDQPHILVLGNETICEEEALFLRANVNGTITWYLDGVPFTSISGLPSFANKGLLSISALVAANRSALIGAHNFSYSVIGGTCSGSNPTKLITINPNPIPSLVLGTNCAPSIPGTDLLISTSSGSYSTLWNDGLTTNVGHAYYGGGVSAIVITSPGGCTRTVTKKVVQPDFRVRGSSSNTLCNGSQVQLKVYNYFTSSGSNTFVTVKLYRNGVYVQDMTTDVVSVSQAGAYTVIGEFSNYCCTSQIATVYDFNQASVNSETICQGETAILTCSVSNASYLWNNGSTLRYISVTPSTTTSYSVRVTLGSCVSTLSSTVTVSSPPTVANAGTDINGCGTSVQLNGNSPSIGNGTWTSSGGTVVLPGNSTSSFNGTIGNTYTLTWTIVNAPCPSTSDNVEVVLNPYPQVTALPTNSTICSNGSGATLTASNADSYLWTPATGLTCTNCSTTVATPASATTYTVTGTDGNGCSNTATASVALYPTPTVSITGSTSICEGDLLGTATTGTISNYEWYLSNVLVSSGPTSNTYSPLVSGSYSVKVTNSNGCTATSSSVSITFYSKVIVSAGANQQVCAGKQIQLSGNISGGITTGHWSVSAPATGTFSPNTAQNAVYSFSDADLSSGISSLVFTLTSDDPTGPCPAVSATMTVTIDKNCCENYQTTISQTDFNTPTLTLITGKNVYSSTSIITLTQNLQITGGALSFPANYRIVVPAGINLMLTNTRLHACGDMWQGIIVEPGGSLTMNPGSKIEDAETAVLLRQTTNLNSNLSCDHATFSGNYIGIKMEANAGLNFNNIGMSIVSTTFNSPNITLRHSGNLTTSNQSYAGMYLNNWTGIIGKYGSQQNLFDHQNIGIRSNQCVLTVMTSKFSNVHIDPIYTGIASGTGIYSEGNDPGYLLKQYGFGQTFSPSFSNCELGIYSNGVPVTIIGNNMTEMNHGILLSKLPAGSTSSVTVNTINCNRDGIISQFPEGIKNLNINANNILVDNTSGTSNYGIGIASYDGSLKKSNISILSNIIEMNRGTEGILIQGVQSNIVANNTVNFVNASVEGASGISGYDAKGNIISCNSVFGSTSVSTFNQRGYHFGLSQANEISCNYSTDIYYGFEFNGGCEMRDQYIGNTMNNHNVGLYLTMDGLIDEQWHRGNKWLGAYSNPNSNEAVDFNPTVSRFFVNPNDGTDFNPAAPDPANGFFISDNSSLAFRCDEQKVCGSKEGGSNNFGDISEMIAEGTYNPTNFPEESKWLARVFLFQKLLNEPTALIDPTLLAFYNYNLNGNIEKINQIRLESENLDSKSASDSTILENNDSLLHETMYMIESCSKSYSEGNITEQQYNSTIGYLKQVIESLVNSNKQISDALKTQKGTNADNIRSFNDVISSTEHYELNEKFVNDVYLRTVAKGNMEIPISDQSQLLSIAHECPFTGGQSVYIARSLYRLVNQNEFYDDYPLCHAIGLMRKRSTGYEGITLQSYLYPNPANNTATLAYYLEENTKTTLNIFDSSMKLSSSELLNVSDREKVINLEKLTSGLYIYNIIQNDHVISSGKFSIVH